MTADPEEISRRVKEYIVDVSEHLLSLLGKEDREQMFNTMAKQFNIKIQDINQKKQPMHIEMVRQNFSKIVSALKVYETKQLELEKEIKTL